jgi:hypothetical protein
MFFYLTKKKFSTRDECYEGLWDNNKVQLIEGSERVQGRDSVTLIYLAMSLLSFMPTHQIPYSPQ